MTESNQEEESSPGILGRIFAAAQNGIEIARFGGLGERQPYSVISDGANHRLRRSFAEEAAGPPALLVPPLMMTSEVWDVAPDSSAVAALHASGADPWVVDFGSPEVQEGGLERDLTDHVLAVSHAVDVVRETTGRDVHLMGYSQDVVTTRSGRDVEERVARASRPSTSPRGRRPRDRRRGRRGGP